MIFRKKQTDREQNSQIVPEVSDMFSSSVMDGSQQIVGNALKNNTWERKREVKRLLISFGILLIVGVSLCFLIPYAKTARTLFIITPSFIIEIFLLPLFWVLIGWTVMQVFGVLGIVQTNHTRLSRAIHIGVLSLLFLYVVIMFPFVIESIKADGFYQIPLFLQKIELIMINIKFKSAIFAILGVILCLCRPDKQKRHHIITGG